MRELDSLPGGKMRWKYGGDHGGVRERRCPREILFGDEFRDALCQRTAQWRFPHALGSRTSCLPISFAFFVVAKIVFPLFFFWWQNYGNFESFWETNKVELRRNRWNVISGLFLRFSLRVCASENIFKRVRVISMKINFLWHERKKFCIFLFFFWLLGYWIKIFFFLPSKRRLGGANYFERSNFPGDQFGLRFLGLVAKTHSVLFSNDRPIYDRIDSRHDCERKCTACWARLHCRFPIFQMNALKDKELKER